MASEFSGTAPCTASKVEKNCTLSLPGGKATPGVTKHIIVISVAVSATERDRDTGTSRERGKLVLAQLTTGIPASLQGL